jgi:hypothetical protein
LLVHRHGGKLLGARAHLFDDISGAVVALLVLNAFKIPFGLATNYAVGVAYYFRKACNVIPRDSLLTSHRLRVGVAVLVEDVADCRTVNTVPVTLHARKARTCF